MSDAVAAPAAPVAPTNGAHPATPQKPAVTKPVDAKPPEVDDSEEYVVDGKPVRLNKAQRQLHFQKALAADKRLKEAADQKNKLTDREKLWEENWEEAMRQSGKDPEKILADHLAKKAAQALKSPEQIEAEKAKAERDATAKKLAEYEKKEQDAKQAEADNRTFQNVQRQLLAAADKYKLDGDPDVLDGLAAIGLEFLELEIPLTADQICEEYIRREREHIEGRDRKLLSVLKGKKLLDYIGPTNLAAIKAAQAEADAQSLNEIPKPQARPKVPVRAHERTIKGGHISEGDFDKKFLR